MVISKQPPTCKEIFKAIQLLGDVSLECYGDPTFDQLARTLHAVSCTLQKESCKSLHMSKITNFFGECSYQDLLHYLNIFKHLVHTPPPIMLLSQLT